MFCWEEKLFMGQQKRECKLDKWTDFLWGNKISELCIKNVNNNVYVYVLRLYLCNQTNICMSVKLLVNLTKNTSEIEVKFFAFFAFFIKFLIKTLTKSIIEP